MLKRTKGRDTCFVASMTGIVALALVGYAVARPTAGDKADGSERQQRMLMLLEAVDPTDSQRTTIEAELAVLMPLLDEMHQRRDALLKALHKVVQSETVDTVGLEHVRLEMVSQIDVQSREVVARMAAIASALTTEQRVKLGKLMKAAHGDSGHGEHAARRHHRGH